MNILVIDYEQTGLPFAMRCQDAGHSVRFFVPKGDIGKGIVPRVNEWESSMKWADLIVLTDNTKYQDKLGPYFRKGFPIFGSHVNTNAWEHDRKLGQEILKRAGIPILECHEFSSFDKAIQFVKQTDKEWVCKPWGGEANKDLTYIPRNGEDLIFRLGRWKKEGLHAEFILQEKISDGVEMGVGGWFGPGGWAAIEENFEHKKLMNDEKGPATGEMGTVLSYVDRSLLFAKVLQPLEGDLYRSGFCGSIDVNCMIDKKGNPWPLEFTCRLGWPAFNLNMHMHKGDPAEWMKEMLDGNSNYLQTRKGVCIGVVMATGDFPYNKQSIELWNDWPITFNRWADQIYLTSVKWSSPLKDMPKQFTMAGNYVLVVCGRGDTVKDAREDAYAVVRSIDWPISQIYRTDIGKRLEKQLPLLHKNGYATEIRYG